MEYETKEEETISKYLLGDLSEDEMQTVEERLMTDNEFSELALLVENKLVDDYVEGTLEGRDRERFERLFLSTPQGREQVRFTRALKEYATKAIASEQAIAPHRPLWQSPVWAFAAAIILIAAGIGIWGVYFSESEIDKGLTALNRAYQERPLDVRITRMDYAPRPNTRGNSKGEVDYTSIRQAERIFRDHARENPDSASFHALGRFFLTQKDFDQAIAQFKKAIEIESGNARLHSDLGAAHLEKGKALEGVAAGRGAEEFAQSLEHLNRAIELDPNLLDALFNRALLYQQMSRFTEAGDAWQKYLEKDSGSQWADEARKYIQAIEEQKKISFQPRPIASPAELNR